MDTSGMMRAPAVQSYLIVCLYLSTVSCGHKVAAVVPAPAHGPIVLPSGTVLAFIAAETIDSGQPSANRAYAAVISRDIKQGEPQKILPDGSPVTLVLMPVKGGGPLASQLGISSVMLNGDSFLVKENGEAGAPIGTFLGGVPGRDYSDPSGRPGEPAGLIVSGTLMHILPGSLLTFRLQQDIVLTGSAH